MALGLCPSAEVCVLGRANGHGPLVVRAGTVRLMLRSEEAAGVEVEARLRDPGAELSTVPASTGASAGAATGS